MANKLPGIILAILFLLPVTACAQQPTDEQVSTAIINQSIADYQSTGHPCACPYNVARNGSMCGRRSAYSRPGGAAPICYNSDVTKSMIDDWRASH